MVCGCSSANPDQQQGFPSGVWPMDDVTWNAFQCHLAIPHALMMSSDSVVNLVFSDFFVILLLKKFWHPFLHPPRVSTTDIPRSVAFLASRMIRSLPSLFLCFWSVWLAWLMEVTTVQSLRQVASRSISD